MGSDLTAGKGTVPEGVIDLLRGLEGVRNAFYLDRSLRERLLEVECLSRAHVACIVKDKTFRPPPKATVVLIDDSGREIGRELLPGEEPEKRPGQKLLWLSKDFVIYYDGRRAGHSRFVLPPVPFREVEEYPGTARVCSSSPSTLADVLVKRAAGLEDDPKLATVLIGFDLA
jgi:hypothetical protein